MSNIYGLYDASGALRYIGKANDPAKRLAGHMRASRKPRTPVQFWIAKHGMPVVRVIESNCADWRESERRLIAEARSRGERLLNLADGGEQPFCPPEVRVANGKKVRYHPEAVAVRKRNGRLTSDRINGRVDYPAHLVTWHRIKKERYETALTAVCKFGTRGKAEEIARRMMAIAKTDPLYFREWGKVYVYAV